MVVTVLVTMLGSVRMDMNDGSSAMISSQAVGGRSAIHPCQSDRRTGDTSEICEREN